MRKPMAKALVCIALEPDDLCQALEGLAIRAESWEKTAEYLRAGQISVGEAFIIEECSDAEEAARIAARYRTIVRKIRAQMR